MKFGLVQFFLMVSFSLWGNITQDTLLKQTKNSDLVVLGTVSEYLKSPVEGFVGLENNQVKLKVQEVLIGYKELEKQLKNFSTVQFQFSAMKGLTQGENEIHKGSYVLVFLKYDRKLKNYYLENQVLDFYGLSSGENLYSQIIVPSWGELLDNDIQIRMMEFYAMTLQMEKNWFKREKQNEDKFISFKPILDRDIEKLDRIPANLEKKGTKKENNLINVFDRFEENVRNYQEEIDSKNPKNQSLTQLNSTEINRKIASENERSFYLLFLFLAIGLFAHFIIKSSELSEDDN